MYLTFRALLLGFIFACIPFATHAQVSQADAEALLRKSGLWKQLADIESEVRKGMADALTNSATQPSAAEQDRLNRAIDAAYSVHRLRAVSLQVIAGKLSSQHAASISKWYDSRLGKSITALDEVASAQSEPPEKTIKDGTTILKSATPQRRALIDDMVKVTRSSELGARMVINIALAVERGAKSVGPSPSAFDNELKTLLEAQRPQMEVAMGEFSRAAFAKWYVPLSMAELTQYMAFLKTSAGRHFNDLTVDALEAAFVDASEEFGRRLPGTQDKSNS